MWQGSWPAINVVELVLIKLLTIKRSRVAFTWQICCRDDSRQDASSVRQSWETRVVREERRERDED